MRPDIVHFGAEGQSSQRDQRTGGRSMPTPSIIDSDLSGCRTWPWRHADADLAGAGQTLHGGLRFERQAGIAGAQFAGRGQLCFARRGDDQILDAAGKREQQFIAEFVERERERHALFGEQRRRPLFERRPERADGDGDRR